MVVLYDHILKALPTFLDPTGPPRQARFGPCLVALFWAGDVHIMALDFGFQYALVRNNWSKTFWVEYWTLPGSNSPWRP